MSDDPEVPNDDARRFNALLGRVLRVSKDELKRREAEYQKERAEKRDEIRERDPRPTRT